MDVLFYAFANSDYVGKGIVLLLLVFSCVVWSIFLAKWLYLRQILRSNKSFAQFRTQCSRNPLAISGVLERTNTEGPLFAICRAGIATLREILNLQSGLEGYELERAGVVPRELTDREIDQIYAAMSREINAQQEKIEESISRLGTLGSMAPMFGLLGTVWGVMATFVGIVAAGGRPDIQHIAPGISGALLTTVLGLVVAIPVIGMSNAINAKVAGVCTEMDNFTQEFLAAISTARTSTSQAGAADAQRVAPPTAGLPGGGLQSPFAHGGRTGLN